VIESACWHLVEDRMHITGARWGPHGADAVLQLRAMGFHSKDHARVQSWSERRADVLPGERGGFVFACYFDHVDRHILIKSIELIKVASFSEEPAPSTACRRSSYTVGVRAVFLSPAR
jgi:hypothetical protein